MARTAAGVGGGETSLARRGGEGRWDAALKMGEEEDGWICGVIGGGCDRVWFRAPYAVERLLAETPKMAPHAQSQSLFLSLYCV